MQVERSQSPEDTRRIAAALADGLADGDTVLLSGDLGVGKTQFAQGFAQGLGVAEAVTSPTFNIMFEYASGRVPLYHFDLYRLDDASQLEDVDFYGLVDASTPGIALVEWADLFPDEMPDDAIRVRIARVPGDDGARMIEMER